MKNWLLIILVMLCSPITLAQHAYPVDPYCTDSSRECLISAAKKYLNALLSHDPSNIPLADNANRWENAVNTATSADKIRDSIKNDIGIRSIKAIREVEWFVDGNNVISFFLLDLLIPNTKNYYGTIHVAEKFKIENGLINDIEVIFCSSGRGKEEPRHILPSYSMPFICSRNTF